jgi:hypothetical protein
VLLTRYKEMNFKSVTRIRSLIMVWTAFFLDVRVEMDLLHSFVKRNGFLYSGGFVTKWMVGRVCDFRITLQPLAPSRPLVSQRMGRSGHWHQLIPATCNYRPIFQFQENVTCLPFTPTQQQISRKNWHYALEHHFAKTHGDKWK